MPSENRDDVCGVQVCFNDGYGGIASVSLDDCVSTIKMIYSVRVYIILIVTLLLLLYQ